MQDFYSIPLIFKQKKAELKPVFLPFAGCKNRCMFCSQNLQTGKADTDLAIAFENTRNMLEKALRNKEQPFELAFYGGTFTLLPDDWQDEMLSLGQEYIKKGLVTGLRCSTRPDAIDSKHLQRLKNFGIKTVELGIQSFDNQALTASARYYSGLQAKNACVSVKKAGLKLVIQLMPGMPGVDVDIFKLDIKTSILLAPDAMRLYPCLVINGTNLADVWGKNQFQPWELNTTIKELGSALLKLSEANIPVIRLGLAPEASLLPNILAGPWHPSLGSQVQAEAIFLWLEKKINSLPGRLIELNIPARLQGSFWGDRGSLKKSYEKLGIRKDNISFWQWPLLRIRIED